MKTPCKRDQGRAGDSLHGSPAVADAAAVEGGIVSAEGMMSAEGGMSVAAAAAAVEGGTVCLSPAGPRSDTKRDPSMGGGQNLYHPHTHTLLEVGGV